MKSIKLFAMSVVLCGAGAAAAYRPAPIEQGQPSARVLTPQVSAWGSRKLEGGVQLDTLVTFLETVERTSDGVAVRPLLISMNFKYALALLQSRTHFQLHALNDVEPIELSVAGVSPQLAVPHGPSLPVLDYAMTLAPKTGFTWGTIRGAADVEISVVTTHQ